MIAIRDTVLGALESVLTFLHDVLFPVFGAHSWGWAIIVLTLIVRVLLLPLAIKQTRSMRAMQAIQPQMKALQKKYKVDRELLKKDPEQYKAKKAKLNEEMMALYREEGANPAASCLPLLAQAPIFIALFWTLRGSEDLAGAPFYFITQFVAEESTATGLAAGVSQAGWPGWLLILLMSGSMFYSQKQMMARTALTQGDANPMGQQQKIMLYAMPIFLAVVSFQFPLGILLYWVTTNAWQVAQQAIILREVNAEQAAGTLEDKPKHGAADAHGGSSDAKQRRSPGASSGKKPVNDQDAGESPSSEKDARQSGAEGTGKGPKGQQKGAQKKGKESAEKGRPEDRSEEAAAAGGGTTGPDEPHEPEPSDSKDGHDVSGPNGKRPSLDQDAPSRNGGGKARSSKRDHLPRRPRG